MSSTDPAGGASISVRPADLQAHADALDIVANEVGTAAQAGQQVRLDAGAYGQLCTIVPTVLGELQDLVTGAIAAAGHSVSDTAARLRVGAVQYQTTDQSSSVALHGAGGQPGA